MLLPSSDGVGKKLKLSDAKEVQVQSEKFRGPSACQPRCYCSRRTGTATGLLMFCLAEMLSTEMLRY